MGLNGLEPSTSRLSGGRSNQLSYKPLFNPLVISAYSFLFPDRQCPSLGSLPVGFPQRLFKPLIRGYLSSSHLSLGGDNRDRTDDPLLAKQVLSQLSYTPI